MYRSYFDIETLKGEPWRKLWDSPVHLRVVGGHLSDDCMHLEQAWQDEDGKWHEYRGIPMSVHFNPGSAIVIRRIA